MSKTGVMIVGKSVSKNSKLLHMEEINKLSIDELWSLYGATHDRLKQLGEIRSKNITGDRGEQIAISYYGSTKGLPKLQMAPPSTKNIDAISTRVKRL